MINKQKNKGFTLIELLVVVAIIAILALVVLLALNPVEMQRKTRDSRRLSDMATIRKAIDLATADGKTLTTTGATWITLDNGTDVTDMDGNGLDVSKYLSVFPLDPVNNGIAEPTQTVSDACAVSNVNKDAMNYQYKSDGNGYVLRVRLESLDNCNAVKNDGNATGGYYHLGTDPGLDL